MWGPERCVCPGIWNTWLSTMSPLMYRGAGSSLFLLKSIISSFVLEGLSAKLLSLHHTVPVGRLVIVFYQSHYSCVVRKLNDCVCVMGWCAVRVYRVKIYSHDIPITLAIIIILLLLKQPPDRNKRKREGMKNTDFVKNIYLSLTQYFQGTLHLQLLF